MAILLVFSSFISPIAIPATESLIGTHASNNESVEPQILACELDPFEDKTSETNLIVYGNSSSLGKTGTKALSAKAPWPISRLPGLLKGLTSPTLKGGKLYWCIYLLSSSSITPSKTWTSPGAPKVVKVKTWVCPLVNNPEPWVLGKSPLSQEIFLTSSSSLSSGLIPSSIINLLTSSTITDSIAELISPFLSS